MAKSENQTGRMKEINADIKTLGDRATLLTGYLVIVVLALASFTFGDFGSPFDKIRVIATILFFHHLATIFYVLVVIIIPSFGHSAYDEVENMIEENEKKLNGLRAQFKFVIWNIIISFPLALLLTTAI